MFVEEEEGGGAAPPITKLVCCAGGPCLWHSRGSFLHSLDSSGSREETCRLSFCLFLQLIPPGAATDKSAPGRIVCVGGKQHHLPDPPQPQPPPPASSSGLPDTGLHPQLLSLPRLTSCATASTWRFPTGMQRPQVRPPPPTQCLSRLRL